MDALINLLKETDWDEDLIDEIECHPKCWIFIDYFPDKNWNFLVLEIFNKKFSKKIFSTKTVSERNIY
jgi:hypothetical protein